MRSFLRFRLWVLRQCQRYVALDHCCDICIFVGKGNIFVILKVRASIHNSMAPQSIYHPESRSGHDNKFPTSLHRPRIRSPSLIRPSSILSLPWEPTLSWPFDSNQRSIATRRGSYSHGWNNALHFCRPCNLLLGVDDCQFIDYYYSSYLSRYGSETRLFMGSICTWNVVYSKLVTLKGTREPRCASPFTTGMITCAPGKCCITTPSGNLNSKFWMRFSRIVCISMTLRFMFRYEWNCPWRRRTQIAT